MKVASSHQGIHGATLSNEKVVEYQRLQEEQKKAAKRVERGAKADQNKWSQGVLIAPEEWTIQVEVIPQDENTSHCFKCSGAYDDNYIIVKWIWSDTCHGQTCFN